MEDPTKYHVYLDYEGYIIDPTSYRTFPAPLMGTRFATGRSAYSNLDFWQVGALTDFTKGINQKFLVDPSQYYYSEGIDVSKEGEIKLERDLVSVAGFPIDKGTVTAQYRSIDALYLGMSSGWILSTTDGITFTEEQDTSSGQIYNFYEMEGCLFATKGDYVGWAKIDGVWGSIFVCQEFTETTDADNDILYGNNKNAQSFKVVESEKTFQTLSLRLSRGGTPIGDITVRIETDNENKPSGNLVSPFATFIIPKASIGTSWSWIQESSAMQFELKKNTLYWIVLSSAGTDSANYYKWSFISGIDATYENGNRSYYEGDATTWFDYPDDVFNFKLFHDIVQNLYFVMAESDYAFGMFDDGIRQSVNGADWSPPPPDPLWELPSSEGIALNAIPIQRGFLIGAKRGMWIFIGGGSAMNIWLFPDYASANNFRGMAKFGIYGVFSVEGQGLWYTDGSGIYPTNLNWQDDPFKVTSCKSILTSGWDMFALVSDGTSWYLMRCNMINSQMPKYWWVVKKLTKEPVYLSALSGSKVFVHYLDKSCEVYNKISGIYQTSGYLISPLIDENLVLLQKFYSSISSILSIFPINTTVSLAYRLTEEESWLSKEFLGGSDLSITQNLANPTLGNRIQIKNTLTTTDTSITPVVTDICWTYVLERKKSDSAVKKNWHFTVLAEDVLEKLDFDKEELGRDESRTRQNIMDELWNSRAKKQILNYIGADNIAREAFKMQYTGTGDSCLAIIDRTNYKISTYIDEVLDQEFSYQDKKIVDLVAEITAVDDYSAEIDNKIGSTELSNDLMPDQDIELKGNPMIYIGTDVHAVMFATQSPGQFTLSLEGRGSARMQISLSEV